MQEMSGWVKAIKAVRYNLYLGAVVDICNRSVINVFWYGPILSEDFY